MTSVDEFTRRMEENGWRSIGTVSGENTSSGCEAQCYQLGDGGDKENGLSSLRIEEADPQNFHVGYSQTSGKKISARRYVIPIGITAFRKGDPRLKLMEPDLELSGQIVGGVPNKGATEVLNVVGF